MEFEYQYESSRGRSKNMPINLGESDSETDFEDLDGGGELENELLVSEAKALWKSQFEHLLEFSEQILPMALYEPMKWCHVSICDSLKHIAKTEEILRNMGNDTLLLLERQLKLWERRQQSSISKSRIPYSVQLYKHAPDIFYCILNQNRELPSEVRLRVEVLFEAQFGKSRLTHARLLLKFCLWQYSQIEDFLSSLPEIYRSESLSGLICFYLNPMLKDERGVVVSKINDLLSSPDYRENQISLMLLTREDCEFKDVILECLTKYLIPDTQGNTSKADTDATRMESCDSNLFGSTTTRYRLKLFLEAEPTLLVKACAATQLFSPSLFCIFVSGLDIISVPITTKRSTHFEDFKPPLFGDNRELSLPVEYLKLMKRMKEAPSSSSLLEKVMTTLKKAREQCVNKDFWIELFRILNDSHKHGFSDHYHDLCQAYP